MIVLAIKRNISIIYKCLIFLCAIFGILLQCGLGTDNFSLYSFRMFTTLSNLAVAVFYLAYIIAEFRRSGSAENSVKFRYFKFLITMSILLTGLVAHFMLQGMFDDMDATAKAGLTFLHYVVPIGTFLDWFLFDVKGNTKWKMPLFAALFPIVYVAVSMIAAQFLTGENKYPYPFLNVDALGAGAVALNIVLIALGFFAVGYLAVAADHGIMKPAGRSRT